MRRTPCLLAIPFSIAPAALAQPQLNVIPQGSSYWEFETPSSFVSDSESENVFNPGAFFFKAGTEGGILDFAAEVTSGTTAAATLIPEPNGQFGYQIRVITEAEAIATSSITLNAYAETGASVAVQVAADRDYWVDLFDPDILEQTGNACVVCFEGSPGPVWLHFKGDPDSGIQGEVPVSPFQMYPGDVLQLSGRGEATATVTPSIRQDASRLEALFTAILTPDCFHDMNLDGIIDNGDISTFIDLFVNQQPEADFNRDGIVDNGDIGAFINRFLAGCP